MIAFYISIFTMALGGLGAVVYKHPDVGINIIQKIFPFCLVVFLVYYSYKTGENKGMYKSTEIISKEQRQTKLFNEIYDSQKETFFSDSLTGHKSALDIKFTLLDAMSRMKVMDTVVNNINSSMGDIDNEKNTLLLYFLIAVACLSILYLIATLFKKAQEKKVENID